MDIHTADSPRSDAALENLLETKDQEIARLLAVLREQSAALDKLKTSHATTVAQAQETKNRLEQQLAHMAAEADKAHALAHTHQQEASRLLAIQTNIEERYEHVVQGLDSLRKQNADGHDALRSTITDSFASTHAEIADAKAVIHTLTSTLAERIRALEQLIQGQIQSLDRSVEKTAQLATMIEQYQHQQIRHLDAIFDQFAGLLRSRFVRWPLIVKTWLTSAPGKK